MKHKKEDKKSLDSKDSNHIHQCSCGCDHDHDHDDNEDLNHECDCGCDHDHECDCDNCNECEEHHYDREFLENQPLPSDEEICEINDILNRKYNSVLFDNKEFKVSYKYEYNILTITVLLSNKDQSFYYPVEARIQPKEQELSLIESFYFLLDYVDLYFEEYLYEDENLFIPIDWTNFEYDAINFQLRGQILNLKLEKQADELIKDKEENKENK